MYDSRSAARSAGRGMSRWPLRVLGRVSHMRPPRCLARYPAGMTVSFSNSLSCHSTSRQGSPSDRMSSCRVMPSVSPSLMPVMNRSRQMSRHFVSGSRAMSRAACPVVRMAISTGSVSGTSVRAAGFRSMSPSAMASPRAVLRMLWVRRAVAAERGSVPVRPSPRRMRFSTMRTWLGRSRSSGTAPMTGVMSMRMRVR